MLAPPEGLPLEALSLTVRCPPPTEDALLPVGTTITARHFVPGQYVDVQGTTKGKGFAGPMKRWGFKGQPASHGHSKSHRSHGSMGGAAGAMYATRIWKGKKMAGRMGGKHATMEGLMVWKVLPKVEACAACACTTMRASRDLYTMRRGRMCCPTRRPMRRPTRRPMHPRRAARRDVRRAARRAARRDA